jgi:O-antigen/teichoic acid export membrane protein
MTISSLFEAYLRARYNIILSNFSNGVLNRLLTAISVLLLSLMIISFDLLIKLQVPIYLTGLFIIIVYAYKKENFNININFLNIKNRLNEITNYSFFSILSGFANILVLNVDVLMVTAILGLSATGIYTTAFYIGLIIEIPRRAISQISIPQISENINNNDINQIEKSFKLVSIHQLIIGVFLYLLIILNLDNIFNIIPNSENFISGKNIVYIIGLSKLIIMTSGFSSELIMMSKYYKFNVITITILAILSVVLNYILIPKFGMIGAAYASLLSILIFNFIKLIFIKIKIGISPFSNKTIIPIILGIIIFFIINYFPSISNPFIDIIKNTIIISSIYLGLIYLLRVSPELNLIIKKIINYQKD